MSDFELLDEELHYEGYAIRVLSTQWRSPSGSMFQRDIVRHPGAVAVAAVTNDRDGVVMVRQFRTALGREMLELPAGLRDVDGEPAEVTGARELTEETGFVAGRLEHLVGVDTAIGFCDERIEIYLATDLSHVGRTADGEEEQTMTVEVVSFDELDALIARGELTDSKTICGAVLARERVRSELA